MWAFTKVARKALPLPTLFSSSLPLLLVHSSSSSCDGYDVNQSSKTQFPQNHFPLHFKIKEPSLRPGPGVNIDGVVVILRKSKGLSQVRDLLVASDIHLTEEVVVSVIWELINEWKLALLLFRCWKCDHSTSTVWNLMVWVLAHHARFTTAWTLIRHMLSSSMDARPSLLIMIQSYAVANFPGKAIKTFQAMEKLRIRQDSEALHTLLHALCTNGNIEEAQEFMHLNKRIFPLQTKSFNIILNGWCNVSADLIEAKRVWREMSSSCVAPDATSYAYMISCISKAGNLLNSIKLYDEMKKRGWVPGLEVYNSLIYALSRENCMKEAFNLVDKIKEAGLQPDSNSYNSMILPLCEAHKLEEAKGALRNMTRAGLRPTIETYHAFVVIAESAEEAVEVLKSMKKAGCGPYGHTFFLVIDKLLFRSKQPQPDYALRMWVEMLNYGIVPDCAHYSIMVRGLASCGWVAKANKFYDDMKLRGIPDDPTLQHMLR